MGSYPRHMHIAQRYISRAFSWATNHDHYYLSPFMHFCNMADWDIGELGEMTTAAASNHSSLCPLSSKGTMCIPGDKRPSLSENRWTQSVCCSYHDEGQQQGRLGREHGVNIWEHLRTRLLSAHMWGKYYKSILYFVLRYGLWSISSHDIVEHLHLHTGWSNISGVLLLCRFYM